LLIKNPVIKKPVERANLAKVVMVSEEEEGGMGSARSSPVAV
jgi:hypothetical protein